jgi:hypothetical protein
MRINLRKIEAFRAAMEFGSATAASDVLAEYDYFMINQSSIGTNKD